MPAYNFQSRFAYMVESGAKRSTIRARRRNGHDAKSGQTLYLFTGMRTKHCRRLLETTCERVRSIRITRRGVILVGGRALQLGEARTLAQTDGFSGAKELFLWFLKTHGLPFSGILIEW